MGFSYKFQFSFPTCRTRKFFGANQRVWTSRFRCKGLCELFLELAVLVDHRLAPARGGLVVLVQEGIAHLGFHQKPEIETTWGGGEIEGPCVGSPFKGTLES